MATKRNTLEKLTNAELQGMISAGTALIDSACDVSLMTRGELREAVKTAKLIGRCYAEKLRRESLGLGREVRT